MTASRLHYQMFFALAVATLIIFSGRIVFASTPSVAIPGSNGGGNFIQPLNGSDSIETKAGSLLLGERSYPNDPGTPRIANCTVKSDLLTPDVSTGCSQLCLNGDYSNSLATGGSCITSWNDLRQYLGGPFVVLSQDISGKYPNVYALSPNSYDKQSGYAAITLDSDPAKNEQIATYVSAPRLCQSTNSLDGGSRMACASSLTPQQCSSDSECAGGICGQDHFCHQTCSTNANCYPGLSEGLYATDGGQATNDAGTFLGRYYVGFGFDPDKRGDSGQYASLCLNGDCLTNWLKYMGTNYPYLHLQTDAAHRWNPDTAQNTGTYGGVRLTGVFQSDLSAIAGSTKSFVGLGNAAATCGDGWCSADDGENGNSCPVDCFEPTWYASSLNLSSGAGSVQVTSTPPAAPGGQIYAQLVVYSTNGVNVNSFTPQSGRVYTVGQVVNGVTVAVVASSNFPTSTSISGLTAGTTYSFKSFLGLGPRFLSTAISGTATPTAAGGGGDTGGGGGVDGVIGGHR